MSDTGSQEKDPIAGTEQPFVQHLKELRDRLVKSFIAVTVMCAVLGVYPGPGQLYDLLAAPLVAPRHPTPHTAGSAEAAAATEATTAGTACGSGGDT